MNNEAPSQEASQASEPVRTEQGAPAVARAAASLEDESVRLAAAQAERFAKKSNEASAVAAAPQVKVVGQLSAIAFDNGQVQVNGPLNNPQLFIELVASSLSVLIQHAHAAGREQALKEFAQNPRGGVMARFKQRFLGNGKGH